MYLESTWVAVEDALQSLADSRVEDIGDTEEAADVLGSDVDFSTAVCQLRFAELELTLADSEPQDYALRDGCWRDRGSADPILEETASGNVRQPLTEIAKNAPQNKQALEQLQPLPVTDKTPTGGAPEQGFEGEAVEHKDIEIVTGDRGKGHGVEKKVIYAEDTDEEIAARIGILLILSRDNVCSVNFLGSVLHNLAIDADFTGRTEKKWLAKLLKRHSDLFHISHNHAGYPFVSLVHEGSGSAS